MNIDQIAEESGRRICDWFGMTYPSVGFLGAQHWDDVIAEVKAAIDKATMDQMFIIAERDTRILQLEHQLRAAQASKSIPLTQGKFAIVDPEDHETLSELKWHCVFGEARIYYAATGHEHRLMHKMIAAKMGITGEIDHIDGNTLNNRRSNLRGCSHSQNNANRAKSPNTTSQYKGVHWHKRQKAWEARIKQDKKHIHLGYFESELDAARAYDIAAKERFGEFAKPNLQGSEK